MGIKNDLNWNICLQQELYSARDQWEEKSNFVEEIKSVRRGLREMIDKLGKQAKLVVFEAGNQLKCVALTMLKLSGVQTNSPSQWKQMGWTEQR